MVDGGSISRRGDLWADLTDGSGLVWPWPGRKYPLGKGKCLKGSWVGRRGLNFSGLAQSLCVYVCARVQLEYTCVCTVNSLHKASGTGEDGRDSQFEESQTWPHCWCLFQTSEELWAMWWWDQLCEGRTERGGGKWKLCGVVMVMAVGKIDRSRHLGDTEADTPTMGLVYCWTEESRNL